MIGWNDWHISESEAWTPAHQTCFDLKLVKAYAQTWAAFKVDMELSAIKLDGSMA